MLRDLGAVTDAVDLRPGIVDRSRIGFDLSSRAGVGIDEAALRVLCEWGEKLVERVEHIVVVRVARRHQPAVDKMRQCLTPVTVNQRRLAEGLLYAQPHE